MKPILVMLSWRGGARLGRCLASIAPAIPYFSRIVLSSTSTHDSPDIAMLAAFAAEHAEVELLCTGTELPTMQHQRFWIEHLRTTGARSNEWILWLAYDDELRLSGLRRVVDSKGDWPLEDGTVYLGPWALRHEQPDRLWDGDSRAAVESWTSLPEGSVRMPVLDWVAEQIRQPTYLQMSGSVIPLHAHADLVMRSPVKAGPMRIEMATAVAAGASFVAEFPEPVTIIYGRSNSDRASYGRAARAEDVDLMRRIGRYVARNPSQLMGAGRVAWAGIRSVVPGHAPPSEEWRVRCLVDP